MNIAKLTSKKTLTKDLLYKQQRFFRPGKPLISTIERIKDAQRQQQESMFEGQNTINYDSSINKLFKQKQNEQMSQNNERRSILSSMSESDRQLQDFVDDLHSEKFTRGLQPFYQNHIQKAKFLGKWFKKNDDNNDQKQKDENDKEGLDLKNKNEKQGDVAEEDDAQFDDWQGVKRPGDKTSTDEDEDDDDDDDEPDGGVMMPIPDEPSRPIPTPVPTP